MTRILITAAAGCILTGGIGYLLLPVLRALKAGQSIREIGPTWHNSKAGTPMMGGLMFIFGTILCLVGNFPAMSDDSPFYVLALALCFGLIGFLDDFTKVKFHRNLGLTTLQKAMLQMAVSALFLYAMYRSGFMDTHLYIPFANVRHGGDGQRGEPHRRCGRPVRQHHPACDDILYRCGRRHGQIRSGTAARGSVGRAGRVPLL